MSSSKTRPPKTLLHLDRKDNPEKPKCRGVMEFREEGRYFNSYWCQKCNCMISVNKLRRNYDEN